MKKLLIHMTLVVVALLTTNHVNAQELMANIETSKVFWKGSKPTGSHNGHVMLKEGKMTVSDGVLTGGTFVVAMSTITDADGSKRLEGHLKNADFFDVEKFPTATFVITEVTGTASAMQVTGDLTVKGITKSIKAPASLSNENGSYVFKSDVFNVNRADFNVRYGSKSFFDNLKNRFIDDLMEMSFVVNATK